MGRSAVAHWCVAACGVKPQFVNVSVFGDGPRSARRRAPTTPMITATSAHAATSSRVRLTLESRHVESSCELRGRFLRLEPAGRTALNLASRYLDAAATL